MGPCASKPPDPAHDFMRAVVVRNYGVLGKRMAGGGEEAAAPAPDKHTMIVDPCSARFVRTQGCAIADAGGASGAIYEFIGYRDDAGFPADVVNGIEREGDVFYHKYGWPNSKHVIHCVGYDFRTYAKRELGDLALSPEIARDLLAKLYERLLMETAKSGPSTLRLVPVSAGIFAGPLLGDMPAITAEALLDASAACFASSKMVGAKAEKDVFADYAAHATVELCVYLERDFARYEAAWKAAVAKRVATDSTRSQK